MGDVQSIAVAVLHHVFSRSQRAAYERVVKLLSVRRLTAGFFDVSAGIGQNVGAGQLENMRRADGSTDGPLAIGGDEGLPSDEFLDPAKLDPIQAAMYVSQMYEKEAKAAHQGKKGDGEADEDSDSGDNDEENEDED